MRHYVLLLGILGTILNCYLLIRALIPAQVMKTYREGLKQIGITNLADAEIEKAGIIRKTYNFLLFLFSGFFAFAFIASVRDYLFFGEEASPSDPWWIYIFAVVIGFAVCLPIALAKFFSLFNAWIITGPDGFIVSQPLGQIYVIPKNKITEVSTEIDNAAGRSLFIYKLNISYMDPKGNERICSMKRGYFGFKRMVHDLAKALYEGAIPLGEITAKNPPPLEKRLESMLEDIETVTWVKFSDSEKNQLRALLKQRPTPPETLSK